MRLTILRFLPPLLLASLLPAQVVPSFVVRTVAGSYPLGDGGAATSALLEFPSGVAVDSSGNVFVADASNLRIRTIAADGTITTFLEYFASGISFDKAGNLLATTGGQIVRINPQGQVTVVAGTGFYGYLGDDGPAASARVSGATTPVVDTAGNIYFADSNNHRVRKITPSGTIFTVAGNGKYGFSGNDGPAKEAQLYYPRSVAVDPDGNLYIADSYNRRIRKVTVDGKITAFAGDGGYGWGAAGDTGKATNAQLASPGGLLFDAASSTLYISDSSLNRIRKIGPDGTIRAMAGSGESGFAGDGGMATGARLRNPACVAMDSSGNVYIADSSNHRIRKVTSAGIISTIAGRVHYGGDGGPATSALLQLPEGVAVDQSGAVYFSDTWNNRIRKVTPDGTISTFAGTSESGDSGNGGPATAAKLNSPGPLAMDPSGNLYVATGGNRIRRIAPDGSAISAVAGTGSCCYSGDGGAATSAQFNYITALAIDSMGNVYAADGSAYRVRKISVSGTVDTVAGTGTRGFSGDGGLATAAQIDYVRGLAFDKDGNLYIADSGNYRIRKMTPGGIITTVLGTGAYSLPADGSDAASSPIGYPYGIAFDRDGNLFMLQPNWSYISLVSGGKLYRIGGNNRWIFAGEGVVATDASFRWPQHLAVDSAGDIYVSDHDNNRIRKLIRNTAAKLEISDGDNQTGNAGEILSKPLKVSVMGRAGVPVAGVPVSFAVTAGSATLSSTSTVTDSSGVAGVGITLGSEAGAVTVTVTVAGLLPVRFTLTVKAVAGPGGATQDSIFQS